MIIIVAGRYAAPLLNGVDTLMFWGGTVMLGILFPLGLSWYAGRPGTERNRLMVLMALLVLFGGALLRISVVQAGQRIY